MNTTLEFQPNPQVHLFDKPVAHTLGLCLIFTLTVLCNAGGIAGGGANLPIILVTFGLSMEQGVPLAVLMSVVATTLRFTLNTLPCKRFKVRHPRVKQRAIINYEIVEIGAPAVFVGAIVGIEL